jgi:outer membrane immunogenic protein
MRNKFLLVAAGAVALTGSAFAAEPLPPPPPPPPPQWTGFYVGLNAGGTWSNNNSVNTATAPAAAFAGFEPLGFTSAVLATTNVPVTISGFIGGGQWGGNYQFNNWVVGPRGTSKASPPATAQALCLAKPPQSSPVSVF